MSSTDPGSSYARRASVGRAEEAAGDQGSGAGQKGCGVSGLRGFKGFGVVNSGSSLGFVGSFLLVHSFCVSYDICGCSLLWHSVTHCGKYFPLHAKVPGLRIEVKTRQSIMNSFFDSYFAIPAPDTHPPPNAE